MPPERRDTSQADGQMRRASLDRAETLLLSGISSLESDRLADAARDLCHALDILDRLNREGLEERSSSVYLRCIESLATCNDRTRRAGDTEFHGEFRIEVTVRVLLECDHFRSNTLGRQTLAAALVVLGECLMAQQDLVHAEMRLLESLKLHRVLIEGGGSREHWSGAMRAMRALELIDRGGTSLPTFTSSIAGAARDRGAPLENQATPPRPTMGGPDVSKDEWIEIREHEGSNPYRVDRTALERLVRLNVIRPNYEFREPTSPEWMRLGDRPGLHWPSAQPSSTWVEVARRVRPAVPCLFSGSSMGTGFVVRKDGLILTNRHVVDGARGVVVRFASASLPGVVLRLDDQSDLALVKVHGRALELDLPLTLATSPPELAAELLVIGYPGSLHDAPTLTKGIVSAIRRYDFAPDPPQEYLQTDAPISRGNSGGPIVDIHGDVVGISTFIIGRKVTPGESLDEALGFGIPASTVRRFLDGCLDDLEAGRLVLPTEAEVLDLHR